MHTTIDYYQLRRYQPNLIMWLRITRDFASRITIVYLPIFLYKLGNQYGGTQTALVLVSFFWFSLMLTRLLLSQLVADLTIKIGLVKTIIYGQILFVINLLFLFWVEQSWYWLMVVWVVQVLEQAFFWPAYHTLFSRVVPSLGFGKRIGTMMFFIELFSILAPLMGGWIIIHLGYSMLWLAGLSIALVGLVISLLLVGEENNDRASFFEFRQWFAETRFKKLVMTWVSQSINDCGLILWPLYLFTLIGSELSLGFVKTFISF